jgi:hypothetical protein
MSCIRSRLTFANVVSVIALFVALGGTAVASVIITSNDQVAPDTISGHNPPPGDHSNIISGSVNGTDLANGAVGNKKLANGAVTDVKLANGAVTDVKLADGAVTNGKLADGAVTNGKLANGSVTHSRLSADSVDGFNVASNSLALSDLVGIDKSGSISFAEAAHASGTLTFGVSGAIAGQAALLTWTGTPPPNVVTGPLRVESSTKITAVLCNLGANPISVSNLPVRIVTFG